MSGSQNQPGPSGRPHRRVPTESLVPRQARRFQGSRAGFVTRLLANLLDLVAVAVIMLLLYGGWTLLRLSVTTTGLSLPSLGPGWVVVLWVAVSWLYLTTSWATTGRTFGARVMGIRVVGLRGRVMLPVPAALRAAFCLAFMPGLLWVLVSSQNRSLQDTVLRSSVIHDWTRRAPTRDEERNVTDVP